MVVVHILDRIEESDPSDKDSMAFPAQISHWIWETLDFIYQNRGMNRTLSLSGSCCLHSNSAEGVGSISMRTCHPRVIDGYYVHVISNAFHREAWLNGASTQQ